MKMNAHVAEWKNTHHNSHVTQHPAYRDANNCTVMALKTAFDLSIIAAYCHLREHGRKHRRGPTWLQYREAVQAMAVKRGRKVEFLDKRRSHRDFGKTVLSAQRMLHRKEVAIFNVSGHTLAFKYCQSTDWAANRKNRITSIWRIV